MKTDIEFIAQQIVDSSVKVHKALGPGLLESTYQTCLAYELQQRGFQVETEVLLPVHYGSVTIGTGYRIDMLVGSTIIIENKAVDQILPIHQAQLLTYLKLHNCSLGFLINWNVPLIKDGIKRFINTGSSHLRDVSSENLPLGSEPKTGSSRLCGE